MVLFTFGSYFLSNAVLVIAKQPMSLVILKGKALDEPLVVKLLLGANIELPRISTVQVSFHFFN